MVPKDGVYKCSKCGLEKKVEGRAQCYTTKVKKKEELAVIESNAVLPKTNVPCPKCGNNEAFWVLRQTRSADEPETRIYRCTKCAHSWREY